MNSRKEQIKLDALSVPVGHTTRDIPCPKCPDQNRERGSFTVTRLETGLVYHCYRASCGFKGFIPSLGYELDTKSAEKPSVPKVFRRPLRKLPLRIRKWIKRTYRLTDADIKYNELKYDYKENRIWQPFTSIEGHNLGCSVKKLPRRFANDDVDMESFLSGQKSIAYWQADVPRLDFPIEYDAIHKKRRAGIALVEDKLSAIRVNRFMRCVSLSGSELDDEQVACLSGLTDEIVLALDFDTWFQKGSAAKGYKFWKKYSFFFKKFTVRMIKNDPKEMSNLEIIQEIVDD